MKFSINRELLLRPLLQVAGAVERRQTLPILANVLLEVKLGELFLTGTDLEVELVGKVKVDESAEGRITVPGRKLMDIIRQLPERAEVVAEVDGTSLILKSGRFRSLLSTLGADEFPTVEKSVKEISLKIESKALKQLLDRTAFAMAQQDVRFFLNGMLIEISRQEMRAVATDGHRLALNSLEQGGVEEGKQVILPRKGVFEVQRLLQEVSGDVEVVVGSNHLGIVTEEFELTTKLLDGKFPDYERVIPKDGDSVILVDRNELRQALARTAILSNEKFRAIRVRFSKGSLELSANNPEQEQAEETVSVDYDGEVVEIGFNVSYLQDVLGVLDSDRVQITVKDGNSSALLGEPDNDDGVYVVMPMKL
ncbi:MAG: DNA polymerase III subunit beta [Candidatus Azotimanducaceae bacterium]|uniref:Beta sliding clamp n=1 Tax=OM182 bacterium TaxID=2510334 RepID=A0A520S5N0_9GAMM|nr:DNA polymerase III subunit beta [Gammaproteobacteria bacterium]OUV68377.1 MAG: DNA polymerase III subunit beta [Gammaproteobacteria bacterium TMED133]RZO77734.1 MAG: DNA polymerase III subunit beta [OM182 bacterium]